jgi:hypothetical protein
MTTQRMGRRRILLATLLSGCSVWASATQWHVSALDGRDSNNGLSPATAFATLQRAELQVKPGDVVLVGDGTYTNTDRKDGGAVLDITRSGTPEAWITWKARPGHKPTVRASGWVGIQVKGSYQVIDGFHVMGFNDAIVLLKAQEDAKNAKPDPHFNTNGILVEGRRNPPDAKPHHIVIRNCVVGKNPGGGISVLEADYVTIEDNHVFENAWFMRYGGSGITLLNNWQHDDKPGYHIVVQRNVVWNNKTLVNWEKIGKLSDGNGILLDVTDQVADGATNPNADAVLSAGGTSASAPAPASASASASASSLGSATAGAPPKPKRPVWTSRALVANNLSAFNGGSGIHTFRTAHVDIVNNTTYWNGGIVGYPELFSNNSNDVVILNNIIVPRPDGQVTANSRNRNLRWDYNLYPVAQAVVKGPNDIVADPQFIAIGLDLRTANFRLVLGSPGLDSGSSELPQATDVTGAARPLGKGRDRGAYEQ